MFCVCVSGWGEICRHPTWEARHTFISLDCSDRRRTYHITSPTFLTLGDMSSPEFWILARSHSSYLLPLLNERWTEKLRLVNWRGGQQWGKVDKNPPGYGGKAKGFSSLVDKAKMAWSPRNRLKIVILAGRARLLRLIRKASSLWSLQCLVSVSNWNAKGKAFFQLLDVLATNQQFLQTSWGRKQAVLSSDEEKKPASWKKLCHVSPEIPALVLFHKALMMFYVLRREGK